MLLKIKPILLGLGGSFAVVTPVALAIACGPTTAAPAATPTLTSSLRATPGSTHANVQWTGTVSFADVAATTYNGVEYLAGDFATEATAAAATSWTTTLPSAVDFTHSRRHLWVRARPQATGGEASPLYLDVTTTSGVQQVVSDVNVAPGVAAAKTQLATSAFTGATLARLAVTNPLAGVDLTLVPLAFEVQVNAGAWITSADVSAELSRLATTWTVDAPLAIAGRIRLTGAPQLFAFTPPSDHQYDVAPVRALLDATLATPTVEARITSGTLKYDANSTHDAAVSQGAPVVEGADAASYGRFAYLVGNYPTRDSASSATTWVDAVPTTLPFAKEERYLWIKALPLKDEDLPKYPELLADFTEATAVRSVKGNVNAAPGYANVSLATAKFGGGSFLTYFNSSSKLPDLQDLPNLAGLPLAVQFRFNSEPWQPLSNYDAARQTLVMNYVQGTPLTADVQLVLAGSATDYVFVSPAPQRLDITPFYDALQKYVYLEWGDFALTDVDVDKSTHDNVVWLNAPIIKGPDRAEYAFQYLVTTRSVSSLEANRTSGWSETQPREVSPVFTERFLYTRLVHMATGRVAELPVLKPTTGLTQVRTNVNALAAYKQIDLTTASVTGSDAAQVALDLPSLDGLPLTYELTFNGTTWVVGLDAWPALRDQFVADYVRGTQVTLVARLVLLPSETTRYVFTPPPAFRVETRQWYDLLNATT